MVHDIILLLKKQKNLKKVIEVLNKKDYSKRIEAGNAKSDSQKDSILQKIKPRYKNLYIKDYENITDELGTIEYELFQDRDLNKMLEGAEKDLDFVYEPTFIIIDNNNDGKYGIPDDIVRHLGRNNMKVRIYFIGDDIGDKLVLEQFYPYKKVNEYYDLEKERAKGNKYEIIGDIDKQYFSILSSDDGIIDEKALVRLGRDLDIFDLELMDDIELSDYLNFIKDKTHNELQSYEIQGEQLKKFLLLDSDTFDEKFTKEENEFQEWVPFALKGLSGEFTHENKTLQREFNSYTAFLLMIHLFNKLKRKYHWGENSIKWNNFSNIELFLLSNPTTQTEHFKIIEQFYNFCFASFVGDEGKGNKGKCMVSEFNISSKDFIDEETDDVDYSLDELNITFNYKPSAIDKKNGSTLSQRYEEKDNHGNTTLLKNFNTKLRKNVTFEISDDKKLTWSFKRE